MPDSARLVAALFLGALAFVLSDMIKPLFEEDFHFGYFNYVNVFIGLFVGWTMVGRRAGRGITAAVNNGVTGMVSLIFLGLFVQGVNEMLRLAMRNRYDSAFEALFAALEIGMGYFLLMSTVPIWGVAIAGGVVAGLITEVVWFRWR
ncbi:TrgA family protein [Pseudosulfitobacter sp. SM2401]|uniref:TrgA family protein n=1 Tax=Pseudosulfitobacter sp. SM2401 TaxID=3350098 RepID=UPI0036F3E1F2